MDNTFLTLNLIFLWIVVLLRLWLVLSTARYLKSTKEFVPPGLPVGSVAPDFTARTLQGETVTKATYADYATMLVFFQPNCRACREKIVTLEMLKSKAKHYGVQIVLATTNTVPEVQQMVEELGITLPVLLSDSKPGSLAVQYNPSGRNPFCCLISAAGRVLFNDWEGGKRWNNALQLWDSYKMSSPSALENPPSKERVFVRFDE